MRLRHLAFLLVSSAALFAGGQQIVRVWTNYRDAAYFDRIGEYFGAVEHHSGRMVLRSQPEHRAGFYFLVRITEPKEVPAGSRWVLDVILPDHKHAKTFTFALPQGQTEPVVLLGLTGTDWPGPKVHPLAWHVRLADPEGRELLAKSSFLWE